MCVGAHRSDRPTSRPTNQSIISGLELLPPQRSSRQGPCGCELLDSSLKSHFAAIGAKVQRLAAAAASMEASRTSRQAKRKREAKGGAPMMGSGVSGSKNSTPSASASSRQLKGRQAAAGGEGKEAEAGTGEEEGQDEEEEANKARRDYRPDIVHQCLLTLMASPLNSAGKLLVYIRTKDSQLIEVSPQLTVPARYEEFEKLIVFLLNKRVVKASEANTALLRIIKNDLPSYMPPNSRKIGFSVQGTPLGVGQLAQSLSTSRPSVVVIGAVAKGDPAPKCDFVEELCSISSHSLTAATCCAKLCAEVHHAWARIDNE
eukprot:GHVU01106491.1.p1 GENE.GHVU01106491.1~~GHVU01106491.1.p1  ORF type:complete len:317 (+),score=72.95 GHVU01106491.1:2643-3593(+)